MKVFKFTFLLLLAYFEPAFADYQIRVESTYAKSRFACHSLQEHILSSLLESTINTRIHGAFLGLHSNGNSCYYLIGHADKEQQKPITRNSLFAIGSLTKTFTTTILGHWLTDAKMAPTNFKIDSPIDVSKMIPAIKNNHPISLNLQYLPSYLQLATFTAGYPGTTPNMPPVTPKNYPKPYAEYKQYDFIQALNNITQPKDWPNVPELYSDMSLGLLGQVMMSLEPEGYNNFNTPKEFDQHPVSPEETNFSHPSIFQTLTNTHSPPRT